MSNLETIRPPIIIHCLPRYKSDNLFNDLRNHYTLLDPTSDTTGPEFSTLSNTARAILCVGPTPLTSADLDRYSSVECVIATSAGVNHIDLGACKRRGIRVTSAGESFSDDVADYAVGLVIDVMRRVSAADRFVRDGLWSAEKGYPLGSKVSGKCVGIVGLGGIGARIAKRLEAFECKISYNSRSTKPDVPYTFYPSVLELASKVDVLILCCALTEETHHVANKEVMTALGKKGVIVNVGRGPLIDEKELVRFLVKGEIGGAGLDVFEDEPHVPEELFQLDNVVLSPHKAVMTPESFAVLDELVSRNVEAFFSGKALEAEVKFD